MHVHLLVPDLLSPLAPEPEATPALSLLLARGRRSEESAAAEHWLKERFGLDGGNDAGLAALSLLGDGINPGDDTWLRADPVHLRVGHKDLTLADASLFDMAQTEADGLLLALNRHFGAQVEFVCARPQRWYCRSTGDARINAKPLAQVRGESVAPHLPRGEDAAVWHTRMNEAQMILHSHPINDERESRGALPLNSLWFWGAGRLPEAVQKPFDRVFSDDPLPRGLGEASGASAALLPGSGKGLLAGGTDSGRVLVMLDRLRAPAAYGDADAWQSELAAMERDWFAPLLEALRRGGIGMLTLHACGNGLAAEITGGDLRRFWRRTRPLQYYRNAGP